MKITRLTTYHAAPRWLFLKIETDEGITGWGEPVVEGRARTVEAAVHELGDLVVGRDPARINDLWQALYRGGFYRGGAVFMSAIAGIDQALWDIKGKALGVPVYQLLGGRVRDRMKIYSWVGGDRPADVVAGIETLRAIGLNTFKMNGTEEMAMLDCARAVDAAVERVASIRSAAPRNRSERPRSTITSKQFSASRCTCMVERTCSPRSCWIAVSRSDRLRT